MTVSVEKLVGAYTKIRDKASELTSPSIKEEDGKLRRTAGQGQTCPVGYCKEHEVDSVRTASGLFYRTVKQRYWTSDWESYARVYYGSRTP